MFNEALHDDQSHYEISLTAGQAFVAFVLLLLSPADQGVADAIAAKLIGGVFTSAYVERGAGDKATMFKVRVKFPSEGEAHAAEAKLREFSKDVWIVK